MKLAWANLFNRDLMSSESAQGQRTRMMEFDQPMLWVTLLLMLTGIVMVYSASINLPDSSKVKTLTSHHYLVRQSAYVVISLLAG